MENCGETTIPSISEGQTSSEAQETTSNLNDNQIDGEISEKNQAKRARTSHNGYEDKRNIECDYKCILDINDDNKRDLNQIKKKDTNECVIWDSNPSAIPTTTSASLCDTQQPCFNNNENNHNHLQKSRTDSTSVQPIATSITNNHSNNANESFKNYNGYNHKNPQVYNNHTGNPPNNHTGSPLHDTSPSFPRDLVNQTDNWVQVKNTPPQPAEFGAGHHSNHQLSSNASTPRIHSNSFNFAEDGNNNNNTQDSSDEAQSPSRVHNHEDFSESIDTARNNGFQSETTTNQEAATDYTTRKSILSEIDTPHETATHTDIEPDSNVSHHVTSSCDVRDDDRGRTDRYFAAPPTPTSNDDHINTSATSGTVGSVTSGRYTCRVCGLVLSNLGELGLHVQEHLPRAPAGQLSAHLSPSHNLQAHTYLYPNKQLSPSAKHAATSHSHEPQTSSYRQSSSSPLPGATRMQSHDNHAGVDDNHHSNKPLATPTSPHSDKTQSIDGEDRAKFSFHTPWEEFDKDKSQHSSSSPYSKSRVNSSEKNTAADLGSNSGGLKSPRNNNYVSSTSSMDGPDRYGMSGPSTPASAELWRNASMFMTSPMTSPIPALLSPGAAHHALRMSGYYGSGMAAAAAAAAVAHSRESSGERSGTEPASVVNALSPRAAHSHERAAASERARHLSTGSSYEEQLLQHQQQQRRAESTPPSASHLSRMRHTSSSSSHADVSEARALENSQRLYGFKHFGSSSSLEGDRLNSSGDTARSGETGRVGVGSNGGDCEPGQITSVKTEKHSPGYGDSAAASGSGSKSAPHDALGNLKSLTSSNFAYPSLPGFANAFGSPPWPGNKYSAQTVNGYMQRIMGEQGMMYNHRVPFRSSLGKQTDAGLACQYCGKVCPRPSILKRHMMMHTGERPFECKVCGQRFRAKGSMLFHQKLRHNMDVKLNKALEERYLQIVANQRTKQMREERKKAALNSKDSAAWFHQEVQTWMLQNHLHSQAAAGLGKAAISPSSSSATLATVSARSNRGSVSPTSIARGILSSKQDEEKINEHYKALSKQASRDGYNNNGHSNSNNNLDGLERLNNGSPRGAKSLIQEHSHHERELVRIKSSSSIVETTKTTSDAQELLDDKIARHRESKSSNDSVFKDDNANSDTESGDVNGNIDTFSSNTTKHAANMDVSDDFSQVDKKMTLHSRPPHLSSIANERSATNNGGSAAEMALLDAHAQAFQRMREYMYTPPDASALDAATGMYDDNCNLKENLDRMIMSAFSKLGIDNYMGGLGSGSGIGGVGTSSSSAILSQIGGAGNLASLPTPPAATDGNGREGNQTTSANSSTSISPQSTSRGGGGRDDNNSARQQQNNAAGDNRGGNDDDVMNVEYPSLFPGLKQQLSIRNETVIISRLDGVNTSSGVKVALYKCYLCGRIFHQLSTLQLHLSTHFEKRVTFYQCLYCDDSYRFKAQLVQHLTNAHRVELNLEEGQIPQVPEASEMVMLTDTVESLNSGEAGVNGDGSVARSNDQPSNRFSGLSIRRQDGLYVCRYCNKGFDRSFSVIRHERMHTGFKPCQCRFCGRGFSEPRNLRQHIARFHANSRGASGILKRKHRRHKSCPGNNSSRMRNYDSGEQGETRERHRRAQSSVSHAPASPENIDGDAEETFPRGKESAVGDNLDSPESHDASVLSPVVSEEASESKFDSSAEIANEIREKERLDDDVMVVIPSDAPLDTRQATLETPRSMVSDNTSWSNFSGEGEVESSSGEIMAAPVRSLIGSQFKPCKRRGSVQGRSSTPTQGSISPSTSEPFREATQTQPLGRDVTTTPEARDGATPSGGEEGGVSRPGRTRSVASSSEAEERPSGLNLGRESSVAAMSAAVTPQGAAPAGLAAQYAPLSVSTFLGSGGLPGILPSPLMSPAQAAFFAQVSAGLTSPTMLGGALPFMTSYGNTSSSMGGASASAAATSKEASSGLPGTPGSSSGAELCGPPRAESQSYSTQQQQPSTHPHSQPHTQPHTQPHMHGSVTGSQADREKDERRSEEYGGSGSGGSGKGSSLSRTSSRVYVAPGRNPIKREEACKPSVLPDGRTVYRCTYCNKDFATYSDINRHMDFHEGRSSLQSDIRPYKCKFCDYYARTNSQLKVHMMRHQGIREFHCKLCNYKGVTQSDLNRHMKSQIHMMKAQNECRHCGEGFVSPKNLERHVEERHLGGGGGGANVAANQRAAASMASQSPTCTPAFQAPPLPRS